MLDAAEVKTASWAVSLRKGQGGERRTIVDTFQTRSVARDQYRQGDTCGGRAALEHLRQW